MYDDYEGPLSLHYFFIGVATIAVIVVSVAFFAKLINRIKERSKEKPSIVGTLQFIWMISAVLVYLYAISYFLPDFSFDAANEKFIDHLPFKRGLLGAVTSIVVGIAVILFCTLGVATYLENPKKQDDHVK